MAVIGLKIKDIDRSLLTIFIICYEYSMSYTNTLKLFNISRKYFWTFLEVCNPLIKIGVRKAANIKKSVDRIFPYLSTREEGRTTLNPREDKILEAFSWFLQDSFTDGESCLHITQFKSLPFAKACSSKGVLVASNYDNMVKNLDNISYIELGEERYYKTSRFLFYMEKYSGDTDISELNSLSVKDMLRRISDGKEKLYEKEKRGNK